MEEVNLTQAHLNWCIDIIKRIQTIVDSKYTTDSDKIASITWLVKQGLKVEQEE